MLFGYSLKQNSNEIAERQFRIELSMQVFQYRFDRRAITQPVFIDFLR